MPDLLTKQRALPTRKALVMGLAVAFGLSSAQTLAAESNGTRIPTERIGSVSADDALASASASPAPLRVLANPDARFDLATSISSGQLDLAAQWPEMNRARARVVAELFPEGLAPTAAHTVTNCSDAGPGSLRQTISEAASGDTVDLSALTCSFITLATPVITDLDSLTLIGRETENPLFMQALVPSAGNNSGLISHTGEGSLTIQNLRLLNGRKNWGGESVNGGCIESTGFVTLASAIIQDCTTQNPMFYGIAAGGGISAEKGVTLLSSVVTGNKSISDAYVSRGGGVSTPAEFTSKYSIIHNNEALAFSVNHGGGVFAGGTVSISRSTISANKAFAGGGISVFSESGSEVSIKHSTISTNKSEGGAGGAHISTSGQVDINNSTFTMNESTSETGAGLTVRVSPAFSLDSTIISGNIYRMSGTPFPADFMSEVPSSGSGNLIGWIPATSLAPPSGTILQIDTPLGPLAHNGVTLSHVLLTGSWAMNRGHFTPDAFEPDTDQRGSPRLVGAGVDIGAIESDALFVDGFNKPPLH